MDKRTMVIEKRNIILFFHIAFTFIFVAILSISYQKSQAQEVKEGGQVQKDETKHAQVGSPRESKEEKKGLPSRRGESPLTEEEQKAFEEFAGPGWTGPGAFKTEEQAIKYLKILVKGDENTIRYFQDENKAIRKDDYDSRLATALSAINTGKSKEAFNLAVEVLKNKRDYPEALAEAAQAIKYAHDLSVIPLLREIVKNPNRSVRLQAAGSLLSLGDGDTALPVLDKLAEKEGSTGALYYLFREPGKIIDERGFKILERALNNSRAEIRISAVRLLWESKKIKKEKAEEIAIEMVEKFKNKRQENYGIAIKPRQKQSEAYQYYLLPGYEGKDLREIEKVYYSDSRACHAAMGLLGRFKSQSAISLLENTKEAHTGGGWVCSGIEAKHALKMIRRDGGKK